MSYNDRLRIPNPHYMTTAAKLNISINGFDEDVQKWETRFMEIKEIFGFFSYTRRAY